MKMSEKVTHTPGPWYASPAGDNWWITKASGLEQTVACIAGTKWSGEPREANAQLIAAAPELLAALESMRPKLAAHGMRTDEIDVAIRKAKGEL